MWPMEKVEESVWAGRFIVSPELPAEAQSDSLIGLNPSVAQSLDPELRPVTAEQRWPGERQVKITPDFPLFFY